MEYNIREYLEGFITTEADGKEYKRMIVEDNQFPILSNDGTAEFRVYYEPSSTEFQIKRCIKDSVSDYLTVSRDQCQTSDYPGEFVVEGACMPLRCTVLPGPFGKPLKIESDGPDGREIALAERWGCFSGSFTLEFSKTVCEEEPMFVEDDDGHKKGEAQKLPYAKQQEIREQALLLSLAFAGRSRLWYRDLPPLYKASSRKRHRNRR